MKWFWRFVKRKNNRVILQWLGGGVVVVAGAVWTVFVFFVHPDAPSPGNGMNVEASGGGVAAGRDITGSTITIDQSVGGDQPEQAPEGENGAPER